MRPTALSLIAAALLAAAATEALGQPAPDPSTISEEPMKTSDQVKRESIQGAATAPLRDLNVIRTKIPEVLLQALADPYARPPRNWKCAQLQGLVLPLDAALGPDIDRIPPGDEDLMDRSRETALGAAADLASGAIPFHGWVRKLSGAERYDKLVQSAIVAGNVRRAYLKGLGETRGCDPPATPSHERAGSPPIEVQRMPLRPRYPIHPPAPAVSQAQPGSSPSGR